MGNLNVENLETYIIHELGNPDNKPTPHEFFQFGNAIARARVSQVAPTMGVYHNMPPYGLRLEAITYDGKVFMLADIDDRDEV